MTDIRAWGEDMVTPTDGIGLESFGSPMGDLTVHNPSQVTMGPVLVGSPGYFNPINISIENGVYYVTVYVCCVDNNSLLAQSLTLWFGSLKETDHVKLTVCSKITGIPPSALTTVLGALANTKATIEMILDQIVLDVLAYFYLLANKVTQKSCGALFIPSFIDQRSEDTSAPWKAVHDFYAWIVTDAVEAKRLSVEEGERLLGGEYVVIPQGRFTDQ